MTLRCVNLPGAARIFTGRLHAIWLVKAGDLGFEPSREALRRYWSEVANALLCLRMRRNHRATILNQHWACTGNTFPCFSPATTGWDRLPRTGVRSGASRAMVNWQTRHALRQEAWVHDQAVCSGARGGDHNKGMIPGNDPQRPKLPSAASRVPKNSNPTAESWGSRSGWMSALCFASQKSALLALTSTRRSGKPDAWSWRQSSR